MTEPNHVEIDKGTPTIQLAGKPWPIPLLAFRQNKIVVPALIRIGKPGALNDLNEGVMNDLGAVVYTALSRAHPSLTRNEFEDMPVSTGELMGAINVIAGQTGVLVQGEADKSMATANPSTSTI